MTDRVFSPRWAMLFFGVYRLPTKMIQRCHVCLGLKGLDTPENVAFLSEKRHGVPWFSFKFYRFRAKKSMRRCSGDTYNHCLSVNGKT